MFAPRLHFRFPIRFSAISFACGLTLSLCLVTGCNQSEPIHSYKPPELERGSYDLDRMLVAIVPAGESTWFFKLQGKDEPVHKQKATFEQFLKTIRVPQADAKAGKEKTPPEPTWKAPAEWTARRPSSQMIFRSYFVPNGSERPLTLDVSMLPTPEAGVDEKFLHQNINRWCMQYGNESISEKEIDEFSEKIALTDLTPQGGDCWIVNLSGYFTGRSPMSPQSDETVGHDPHANTDEVQQLSTKGENPGANDPHAGLDRKPKSAPQPPGGAPEAQSTRVKVNIPPDWKPGKASTFIRREVSLAAIDGDQTADISLMALPGDVNDLPTNIARWRGQVGLGELPQADLIKGTQKITVDGAPGDFVELVGSKDTILAAMVKKGNEAWFFKLIAPNALAAKEKAKFEEFVKTTKLP